MSDPNGQWWNSMNQNNDQSYGRSGSLSIPDSPAPQGYLINPHTHVAEEAHALLHQILTLDPSHWDATVLEDGVAITTRKRDLQHVSSIPKIKGTTFIPNFRPIQVLACIHLFSYRLIWDTRMSSGRILERYDYHSFLFYCVWRGIGNVYRPRDAVGVQDVRFWGPNGEQQTMALPTTERIDAVWKSVDVPDYVPGQEDKVRLYIGLGAHRIEWRPDLNGCEITFVGDADVRACIPSYLYNILAKELPKTVGRLRDAMQKFGVPPYVLDAQGCVVIQTTFFYGESRKTTCKHHVSKSGLYSIMLDRQRMFPFGIYPPTVTGPGAPAVSLQELSDQIIVSVAMEGIGLEYTIEIVPREHVENSTAGGGWW